MEQVTGGIDQPSDFLAAQHYRQPLLGFGTRQIHLHVRTSKRLYKQETQRRNSGNDGIGRKFPVVDQMQVILPHVLFVELIGTPSKIAREIFYCVKVALDCKL